MAVDPRHLLAGVLTVTMFLMLGHMIKRDHFDSIPPTIHETRRASERGIVSVIKGADRSWQEDGLTLKPCWDKPVFKEADELHGYVTFSLTNGPEFHVSQIADAVLVARQLRATLVLPDIRGSKPGDKRNFEDVYDVEKFITSLDGVVKVVKSQPSDVSSHNVAVVRVPNRVTEDHIAENIEPIFRTKGNIRLVTYFPSINMKKTGEKTQTDSVACLAMFGTLEPQSEVLEVINSMVDRLRTLSRKSNGQFVAVDLRVDILKKKSCHKDGGALGSKSCYNPQEVAHFLRKMGFNRDTTMYVTQSKWNSSLDALRDFFPKTYTKDAIMPMDKKDKFLKFGTSEFEKVIDFYISTQSDVFVPAISGLFYANVVGKRIAYGRNQILVPANSPGSATSADFISHYVSKRNHFAYSCFC